MVANGSVFNSLLGGGMGYTVPYTNRRRGSGTIYTHEKKRVFDEAKKGRDFLKLTEIRGRYFC